MVDGERAREPLELPDADALPVEAVRPVVDRGERDRHRDGGTVPLDDRRASRPTSASLCRRTAQTAARLESAISSRAHATPRADIVMPEERLRVIYERMGELGSSADPTKRCAPGIEAWHDAYMPHLAALVARLLIAAEFRLPPAGHRPLLRLIASARLLLADPSPARRRPRARTNRPAVTRCRRWRRRAARGCAPRTRPCSSAGRAGRRSRRCPTRRSARG